MNRIERLTRVINKPTRRIIGLMSGMSMDGIDLAAADISGSFPSVSVRTVGTYYRSYPTHLRNRLLAARNASVSEVSKLNVIIAQEFSDCVRSFLAEKELDATEIDAIGSHGQTLYHATSEDEVVRSTLQIGCPSTISELTGILTIGNFRARDVAAGGQGAPLVALADVALHHSTEKFVGYINLGSIANISVVTPDPSHVMAFDLGPANMPIDFAVSLHPDAKSAFDLDGNISRPGTAIEPLLKTLLARPFFKQRPPRAAGYEEFGPAVLSECFESFRGHPLRDLVRTAVEFSARSIADAIKEYVISEYPELRRIVLSGGGVYNKTLVSRIRNLLPEVEVQTADPSYAKMKEALAFAVLAHETLDGRPGNIPSATGAKHAVVLGEIAV